MQKEIQSSTTPSAREELIVSISQRYQFTYEELSKILQEFPAEERENAARHLAPKVVDFDLHMSKAVEFSTSNEEREKLLQILKEDVESME